MSKKKWRGVVFSTLFQFSDKNNIQNATFFISKTYLRVFLMKLINLANLLLQMVKNYDNRVYALLVDFIDFSNSIVSILCLRCCFFHFWYLYTYCFLFCNLQKCRFLKKKKSTFLVISQELFDLQRRTIPHFNRLKDLITPIL